MIAVLARMYLRSIGGGLAIGLILAFASQLLVGTPVDGQVNSGTVSYLGASIAITTAAAVAAYLSARRSCGSTIVSMIRAE